MRIDWSSHGLRLPLSLSLAALLTALAMALALGLQTLVGLREAQGRNALSLAHAMADMQIQALRNDDVWLAYALLRGPGGMGSAIEGAEDADSDTVWILLDQTGRVFASNRPRRFRLDRPLAEALPWLEMELAPGSETSGAAGRIATRDAGGLEARAPEIRGLIRLPLQSDGVQVGELIALLSDAPFLPRFREILLGSLLVTGGILAVLVPLGWWWGQRLVRPLTDLAACMARVGREEPNRIDCRIPGGASEIDQLGRRFAEMLAALAERKALIQGMIQAERLAAVGQVAAGVAHEVNNPLGGMRMAIDTYRRAHPRDAATDRLLDLIERALDQIQSAVSALLVEARADRRPLARADLEDVRTLAQPRIARAGARLIWRNDCREPTGLPAAPVRQLLLNLVLNAAQAAGPDGEVAVELEIAERALRLRVENTGPPLPPERLARLFEPDPPAPPAPPAPPGQPRAAGSGAGFGLWVCDRIVRELGGRIAVGAENGRTRISVSLPLATGGAA